MNPLNLVPPPVKGLIGALAGFTLWFSSAVLGIEHNTVAKDIATAVLVALGADAVTKNDRGAKAAAAVEKHSLKNGADPR